MLNLRQLSVSEETNLNARRQNFSTVSDAIFASPSAFVEDIDDSPEHEGVQQSSRQGYEHLERTEIHLSPVNAPIVGNEGPVICIR